MTRRALLVAALVLLGSQMPIMEWGGSYPLFAIAAVYYGARAAMAFGRDVRAALFHRVTDGVLDLCTVDLSAVFLDVAKDRLYTLGTNSPLRRSTQTAVHHVFRSLSRLLAPKVVAHAHCDVPCGIYEPSAAKIAADTVAKMVEKIAPRSMLPMRAPACSPVKFSPRRYGKNTTNHAPQMPNWRNIITERRSFTPPAGAVMAIPSR